MRIRDRLYLHDEIPESALDGDATPYFRPSKDSIEYQYMMERRKALGGSIPKRIVRYKAPSPHAERRARSPSCSRAPASQAVSARRWASPACCATSPATSSSASTSCRSSPTRARTFGMDSLFPSSRSTRRRASSTSRSTTTCCSATPSRRTARSSRRASPRPGSMAQLHRRRHGVRHPRHADGAVLHVLFDVRVPARRRPHLAGGRRPHPRLPARRHRRPHDAARRGPAAPGRPLARARLDGAGRARRTTRRSPTRSPTIVQQGLLRMYGTDEQRGGFDPDVFYYLTLYNENYVMPADAGPTSTRPHIMRGLYRVRAARRGQDARRRCCSPARPARLRSRPRRTSPSGTTSASSCGRRRRTRRCATRRSRSSGGTGCTPARSHASRSSPSCSATTRRRSSPSPTS